MSTSCALLRRDFKTGLIVSGLMVSLTLVGCNTNANTQSADARTNVTITEDSPSLAKVGYSFGYMMGEGNREMINDLDVDAFFEGFRDAYAKSDPALTQEHMQQTLAEYKETREKQYLEEMQAKAAKNKQLGVDFLSKNAKKEGVKVTDSGLQYTIIEEGTGKRPSANDKVKVHYEGKLLDDTVFDSSYARGEPIIFGLNEVISGWTEGVQLMKEGAKYRFFIPAELAYGETGNPSIEPNSTLLFDIELLEVNPAPPAQMVQ